jgi:putative ABC transport system substrate-binding protein
VRIEYRWDANETERIRKYAAELVALAPDVTLASGPITLGPLLQLARTVPIVFVAAADPVGAGYVESLARPGGNATGFSNFAFGMGAKWLELLKQIAPGVTRAAVLRSHDLRAHRPVLRPVKSRNWPLKNSSTEARSISASEMRCTVGL